MMKELVETRIKDIVVRDVVYANPQDSLSEAVELLIENRVSALPVIDAHRRCVGFLSVTDFLGLARDDEDLFSEVAIDSSGESSTFLRQMQRPDVGNRTVQELMSSSAFTVEMEASLKDAAAEMARNHVHRLAVVDKDQKLIGIISTMDLIEALANGAVN